MIEGRSSKILSQGLATLDYFPGVKMLLAREREGESGLKHVQLGFCGQGFEIG